MLIARVRTSHAPAGYFYPGSPAGLAMVVLSEGEQQRQLLMVLAWGGLVLALAGAMTWWVHATFQTWIAAPLFALAALIYFGFYVPWLVRRIENGEITPPPELRAPVLANAQ